MNTATTRSSARSKTWATWLACLGGAWGLHRFYLHGWRDPLGWLLPLPTCIGLWGLYRANTYGLDDHLSWALIPVLGFTLAATMLQAIAYGLMPDERWHARHNAHTQLLAQLPSSGWGAVLGAACSLMLGATVLMATIAFSGQRYFEYQVEAARAISQ